MSRRLAVLLLPAFAVAAVATAQERTPATTQALAPPAATPSDRPLQRQTGMVVLEREDGQRVIVRSLEPDSRVGGDRLDFEALDASGDGRDDRGEAGADKELKRRFDSVDANHDGGLDREELVDWIR